MQYSGAYNNVSFLSGGADPQTGLYTLSFPFGDLLSADGFGPSFSLSMNYNPLATGSRASNGLGNGWHFNLPNINDETFKVTLLDGQVFTILDDSKDPGKEWVLKNHKVKDVRLIHDRDLDQVVIENKDRSKVIIDDNRINDSFGQMIRYEQQDGRFLVFNGDEFGGRWRLESIEDHLGNILCEVDYGDNVTPPDPTVVTLYPGTGKERVFELELSRDDSKLERITAGEPDMVYRIDHITKGSHYYIESVIHPSGAVEEMEYENEIRIPSTGIDPTFIISQFTKRYGDNNTVVQTYDFDPEGNGHSYFGNGFITDALEDDDVMQDKEGEYHYSSIMTEGEKSVKSTWNKFHQLIETETSYDGGKTVKKQINTYYSDEKLGLKDQEERYELPQETMVQFIEYTDQIERDIVHKSDKFTKKNDFDIYGNMVEETDISGIIRKYEYYTNDDNDSSLPEGAVIPIHPFEMVDFVKQEIVTCETDDLRKTTDFYYTELSKVDPEDGDKQYRLFQEVFSDSKATYAYYDDPSLNHHGVLFTKEIDKDGNKTTETKTYDKTENDSVIIRTTTSTHDDLEITEAIELDIYYQMVLSEVDSDMIQTSCTYDNAGRLIEKVEAADSSYENTISLEFLKETEEEPDFKGWCLQRTDGASGLKTRIYVNDQKEVHKIYEQEEVGDDFFKIKEVVYTDELYRVLEEKEFDYKDGDEYIVNTLRYDYDNWGLQCKTTDERGLIREISYNPFDLTSTETVYVEDNSSFVLNVSSKKSYNLFREIEKEELILGDTVHSTELAEYDGLGRILSGTNKAGFKTDLFYDEYDRVVEIRDGLPSTMRVTYQPFTVTDTVETMQLSGDESSYDEELINVVSDGLSRPTTAKINGNQESYDYPTEPSGIVAMFSPRSKKTGRNQNLEFEYIPELGLKSKTLCAEDTSSILKSK